MNKKIVIAIDGVSASGKGTLAKLIAKNYNLVHLETGLIYRKLGYNILINHVDFNDKNKILEIAKTIKLQEIINNQNLINLKLAYKNIQEKEQNNKMLSEYEENIKKEYEANSNVVIEDLENEEVAKAASVVSKIPEVRKALFNLQRDFALNPPSNVGAVIDGRDIGTVIYPEANLKFFITASLMVRAQRRHSQLLAKQKNIDFNNIMLAIKSRDESDNKLNELARSSKDYILIDSTNLNIDETYNLMNNYISKLFNNKAV